MYTADKISRAAAREAQLFLELRSKKLLEDLSERDSMEMLNNVPVISSEEQALWQAVAGSIAQRSLGGGRSGFCEVSVCVHSFEEPRTYYWVET